MTRLDIHDRRQDVYVSSIHKLVSESISEHVRAAEPSVIAPSRCETLGLTAEKKGWWEEEGAATLKAFITLINLRAPRSILQPQIQQSSLPQHSSNLKDDRGERESRAC